MQGGVAWLSRSYAKGQGRRQKALRQRCANGRGGIAKIHSPRAIPLSAIYVCSPT